MDKNRIEGVAEQGERAKDRKALVIKAWAAKIRRLCGEGVRSYPGRSRLVPERVAVTSRSEKSGEAVVAGAGVTKTGRREPRAEREGVHENVPMSSVMRQMAERSGRAWAASGEAEREAVSDETRGPRRDTEGTGSGSLLAAALTRENLQQAWKRVKANKGSAGVDGLDIDRSALHLRSAWPDILERLLRGTYRPSPVRRVMIPKPDGGQRELGIPTVTDRLIQQALLQVLQPLLDPTFSEHSYGFRPGRRAHDAVLAAQAFVQSGRRVVVDVDLEKFLDRSSHCTPVCGMLLSRTLFRRRFPAQFCEARRALSRIGRSVRAMRDGGVKRA